ncbi:MAG: hypothetical protein K2Q34_08810 [Alphaproteobacteria bacterium]|nr:hypothetical protein [Alphaproteobacteria bacterium]
MKLFAKTIMLASISIILSKNLIAAPLTGPDLLRALYDAIDAPNYVAKPGHPPSPDSFLKSFGETRPIQWILGGRPFTSATLRSADSATLVRVLIDALKESDRVAGQNDMVIADYKRGLAMHQQAVIAKAR